MENLMRPSPNASFAASTPNEETPTFFSSAKEKLKYFITTPASKVSDFSDYLYKTLSFDVTSEDNGFFTNMRTEEKRTYDGAKVMFNGSAPKAAILTGVLALGKLVAAIGALAVKVFAALTLVVSCALVIAAVVIAAPCIALGAGVYTLANYISESPRLKKALKILAIILAVAAAITFIVLSCGVGATPLAVVGAFIVKHWVEITIAALAIAAFSSLYFNYKQGEELHALRQEITRNQTPEVDEDEPRAGRLETGDGRLETGATKSPQSSVVLSEETDN